MGQSYAETRDARGRTTIELHDDLPVILMVLCALSVVPLFFFGWAALLFVLANVLVFGSLSGWFLYARRRMRVTVDAAARALAVESGPKPRVIAFSDFLHAQLGSARNRVELVLLSGEVLPLLTGFGGFSPEDCQRLADRINAEVNASH